MATTCAGVGEVASDGSSAANSGGQNGPENRNLTSPQLMTPSLDFLSREARDKYLNISVPLYGAALKGDWKAAKDIIEPNRSVLCSSITRGWETALHIAAAARRMHLVEELVKRMSPQDLELQNINGNTALCFAAAAGIVGIAEVMVNKNGKLPIIRNSQGMVPIYIAALVGHSEMVEYLYGKTSDLELTDKDRIGIFNLCIEAGLYDVPLKMLQQHPALAMTRDENKETALHILARKPSAFDGGSHVGIWRRFISSSMKVRHDASHKKTQALQLVRCLWKEVLKLDDSEISDLIRTPSRLLFVAAEFGNCKFLIELIRSYPDLIWKQNDDNISIFHIAVLHRHESIFNLLYEIGSIKDLIISYKDGNGNNLLHLAGLLAPSHQLSVVSGAALQMQRELLWFKEVEKIVSPSFVEKKNRQRKKPRDLFTEEHEKLVKEGEQWMKYTASSSMVVATLIATVVFAAAFTVPGGNNDTGTPIFLRKSSFVVFAISDAIALFTSSASTLMFLSILTSRYAEDDFLESLPSKLMIGLTTLFISIITMMVAFSATCFIVYEHGLEGVAILIALFACVPVILYATLQFPLLADMIYSTYGSRYLFKPKEHMLY